MNTMIITHLNKAIRYTGRWAKRENAAITTAPGAFLEIAFRGKDCVLMFDVNMNMEPFPHIYIQVDNGTKVETRVEPYIRVEASENGDHVLKVIFKSAMEDQQRWYEPLVAKLTFIGAEADEEGTLPVEDRKIIEFIGDSITEGIWVDECRMPYAGGRGNHKNMVYQNDSTATYAYLTAEALGMIPCIMGYGSVGITKGGGGGVPKVDEAYACCFHKNSMPSTGAEIIVINHGANDYLASAEEYTQGYRTFLELVREKNPSAKIVVLSAFLGRYAVELGEMVKEFNQSRDDKIIYINTCGWIPKEPVHPARDGHRIVANNLVQKIMEVVNV